MNKNLGVAEENFETSRTAISYPAANTYLLRAIYFQNKEMIKLLRKNVKEGQHE